MSKNTFDKSTCCTAPYSANICIALVHLELEDIQMLLNKTIFS